MLKWITGKNHITCTDTSLGEMWCRSNNPGVNASMYECMFSAYVCVCTCVRIYAGVCMCVFECLCGASVLGHVEFFCFWTRPHLYFWFLQHSVYQLLSILRSLMFNVKYFQCRRHVTYTFQTHTSHITRISQFRFW